MRIEPLGPDSYRRIPWKNGRGALVVIDGEGAGGWERGGVAWHFGRTAIVEEGPFSDYTGYERLQVVIKGAGLVLVAADGEIDLRRPMRPQRYDGGRSVRTRLERGPVEVVNLIADRARFAIDLAVPAPGGTCWLRPGRHVVYAPAGSARVRIAGQAHALDEDHALRIQAEAPAALEVETGAVLVGSILPRAAG